MKIISSAAMLKQRLALKREGRLGHGMDIPPRSPEERVRAARARLAIQGSPALYKSPQRPPAYDTEPTSEWIEKNKGNLETRHIAYGKGGSLKGYRVRPITESHAESFPEEMRLAFSRFLQDSEHHLHISVADLNRAGGGSPGARLGGLGNVPQCIREGHHRHVWLEQQLAGNAVFNQVLRKLVYRSDVHADGKAFDLVEFGKVLWPALKDQSALRWSTKTAVLAFGAELMRLYKDPRCPRVVWIDDDEREQVRRLEGVR